MNEVQSKTVSRAMSTEEACKMMGISTSTHYEILNPRSKRYDPDYPKPIRIGPRSVRYMEHEVINWLEKKMGER